MEIFRKVLIWGFLQHIGVHGCGKLVAYSQYESSHILGQIRLYPSEEWQPSITNKYYQWTKGNGSPEIVGYFRDKTFIAEDPRIVDVDFTLVITGMTKADVNVYRVECWATETRKVYNRTERVLLMLPQSNTAIPTTTVIKTTLKTTRSTTSLTTTLLQSGSATNLDEAGDNSGEVSVVIVMTVVIVGLVIVIFALLIRIKVKTRLKMQQDVSGRSHCPNKPRMSLSITYRRAIAKEEEIPSSSDNPRTGENVYNEIDEYAVCDPDITYAQVKNTQAFSSQGNIQTLGQSPSLPRRDGEMSKSVLDVRMTSQLQVDADKCIQKATSLQDVYAQVLPKTLRSKGGEGFDPPKQTVENLLKQENGEEKANIKRSQRSTIKKGGFQYKSMDCIFTESEPALEHEYSNTVHTLPRSIKRKGSAKSTSELLYIQIDHGPRASLTGDYAEIEPAIIGQAPSSEYVSIDFDKKAFVAPIRKAPSSWYRKRKERKEKQKKMK